MRIRLSTKGIVLHKALGGIQDALVEDGSMDVSDALDVLVRVTDDWYQLLTFLATDVEGVEVTTLSNLKAERYIKLSVKYITEVLDYTEQEIAWETYERLLTLERYSLIEMEE